MGNQVLEKLTINLYDPCVQEKLYNYLLHLLGKQEGLSIRPIVALCIGSDRYTGDALGPLIGSYLEETINCNIFGTLEHPVHAGNFIETLNIIDRRYHHPLIIATDACLGKSHEIGNIEIWQGGLTAGIAVGNRLPTVGHISIIGVVNSRSQIGYLDLQSTPLSKVMRLSKVIGEALAKTIHVVNQVNHVAIPSCK
ncbi:MAG TPA: spore protease YyaC [Methylomusa anaerophila]|uniref:Sporulation protein YyaC n=1 Tax=Methylomusa anaerophila TaxID=1930071 RepID=A0A348ANV8_9FIRM|nr:spore protease YyaC [Methylomusa anaerophila]BBB92756.1 hypothetical protein MAMMFC1_03452 [Methylomusa anaerophila]HML87392.1 spore protease YyaC [Methylomusa anaerophila]